MQPARQLVERISDGELRAEDLVRECLARIQDREGVVGAWETIDEEGALAQARTLDRESRRGPLHGIPIGIKDIIDVAGLPTRNGSPLYADNRAFRDAACVALLRAAGAIPLGKTVTTEFAYLTPGKTTNPHNPRHTPGGSSSGSAAAVVDGMVPLALGSQTAGSVIRPAAFCGTVGYKPTFGMISRAGILPFAESLDTIGVFATTVSDAALLGAAASGRAPASQLDVAAPPRLAVYRTDLWDRADDATRDTVLTAAQALREAGARVEEVPPHPDLRGLEKTHAMVMAFEAARSFAYERQLHWDELSPKLREHLQQGDAVGPEAYDKALGAAESGRRALNELLGFADALLTPSTIGEAPEGLDATGDPLFDRTWTLLHAPAVNLPAGRGPRGLPTGIQLVGPVRGDLHLLSVAAWVEERLSAS